MRPSEMSDRREVHIVNHRAYREHDVRIRTSLERHVGEAATSEGDLLRKAAAVFAQGRGIYFTPAQLNAMPEYSRRLIEAEAKRLYGQ